MIPSEDFVYCPTCRYEICLTKCKTLDSINEHFIPRFAPLSNNVEGYDKIVIKRKQYLCPNDETLVKEEEIK